MKRLTFLLVAFLLLTGITLTTTHAIVLAPTVPALTEAEAIAKVIDLHPEFPHQPGSTPIQTLTGGPAPGTSLSGELRTASTQNGPGTYLITFTKKWNLTFNEVPCTDEWTYQVTPYDYKLIKSTQNAHLINQVK